MASRSVMRRGPTSAGLLTLAQALVRRVPTAGISADDLSRHSVIKRGSKVLTRVPPPSQTPGGKSGNFKVSLTELFKDGDVPLLPGTFIPLPLSQCPRSPREFVRYQWYRTKAYLTNLQTVVSLKLKSTRRGTMSSRWEANRKHIAPTANAMYRSLLEAVAAGDAATIERLCTRSCAARFVAALERRDPKQYTSFSIVYKKPLIYPRLLSHRVMQFDPNDTTTMVEQAAVAINSTQTIQRYSYSTNKPVPGTHRVQDKIENVILTRNLNVQTYRAGNWRIWGTAKATQLKDFLEMLAVMEKEQEASMAHLLKKPSR